MMKKINIKLVLASALLMVFAGCKDSDFDSYKIQSVDNHGNGGSVISTAVTATGSSEFYANAVDASTTEVEYQLIPVALNATDVAPQDIHVTMVPDPESLAAFNSATFDEFNDDGTIDVAHPELYYVMPEGSGAPAFTLVDNGVVTIPKGSSIGYLKIKTTSADYFGATQYAYSYKISGVQESGFVVSGNHYWGIVAIIPKNPYDGTYAYGPPGYVERFTGGVQNPSTDLLQGPFPAAYKVDLVTTGLTTLAFSPLWATGSGIAGIDGTYIIVDPATNLVTMACATNPSMHNLPGEINKYDPATKTFKLAFGWGTANARTKK